MNSKQNLYYCGVWLFCKVRWTVKGKWDGLEMQMENSLMIGLNPSPAATVASYSTHKAFLQFSPLIHFSTPHKVNRSPNRLRLACFSGKLHQLTGHSCRNCSKSAQTIWEFNLSQSKTPGSISACLCGVSGLRFHLLELDDSGDFCPLSAANPPRTGIKWKREDSRQMLTGKRSVFGRILCALFCTAY